MYICYDDNKIIWGTGKTKQEARNDAISNIKYESRTSNVSDLQRSIKCSEILFDLINEHGRDSVSWEIRNGVAVLSWHKNKND